MRLTPRRRIAPNDKPDGSLKSVEGAVVGFFSLEMAAEQLATRILSEFARVPSEKIRRGDIDQEEFDCILPRSAGYGATPPSY